MEECLLRNAAQYPGKTAVRTDDGRSVSYGELPGRAAAAADVYRRLPGYAPGAAVLLFAEKRLEFVAAYFGAHMAGLAAVPLSPDVSPARLDFICRTLAPLAAVGAAPSAAVGVPSLPLAAFAQTPTTPPDVCPRADATADILFTTGTTGAPKAVPLTFANELAAVRQINAFVRNQTEDVELLALPISHSFGLGRLRCCLANAQTVVFHGGFANVKRLFRTIADEHITGLGLVPASWHFLRNLSGDALGRFAGQFNYMELGSSFLAPEDKRHLAELFPTTRVTMHYGLTEASRSTFMEFHDDAEHLASVGRASPGVDVGIFDARGRRLPPGEEGEICIRGGHVTKGYLSRDNAETFFDGYFRTGDCGVMTADGYLSLKSRLKEMINVGGKKVAPTEVEAQILRLPGVADCACVGVPDPGGVLGEVVKACVVRQDGAGLTFDGLAAALRGRLAPHEIPAAWQWIETVPRTHNGKILRRALT